MQTRLTEMNREQKVSASTGKQYWSVRIKTEEHGDKILSGFGNAGNKDWKVGDTVEITVTEVNKDGKTYYNFDNPKEGGNGSAVMVKLNFMDERLKRIEEKIDMQFGIKPLQDVPELRAEDVPF